MLEEKEEDPVTAEWPVSTFQEPGDVSVLKKMGDGVFTEPTLSSSMEVSILCSVGRVFSPRKKKSCPKYFLSCLQLLVYT